MWTWVYLHGVLSPYFCCSFKILEKVKNKIKIKSNCLNDILTKFSFNSQMLRHCKESITFNLSKEMNQALLSLRFTLVPRGWSFISQDILISCYMWQPLLCVISVQDNKVTLEFPSKLSDQAFLTVTNVYGFF